MTHAHMITLPTTSFIGQNNSLPTTALHPALVHQHPRLRCVARAMGYGTWLHRLVCGCSISSLASLALRRSARGTCTSAVRKADMKG